MGWSELGSPFLVSLVPFSCSSAVFLTTYKIDGKIQIIWVFSRTFSIITACHEIPSVIYPFYVVLNGFNCKIVLLVDIAGIIAHYRELLGVVRLCFTFGIFC